MSRALVRAAALAATAAVALTGAVATTVRPAQAVTKTTYGLQASAYGTRVVSELTGVESGRSVWSFLGCTKVVGIRETEQLATVSLPTGDDPYISVEGVTSRTRSFRNLEKGIAAGVSGTNSIASVRIGSSATPKLTIERLRSESTAWATRGGALRTRNEVSTADLDLVDLPGVVPGDVLDLVDAFDQGIDSVLETLRLHGGDIEVPGLGVVSIGYDRQMVKAHHAVADSFVLKVDLYGPDGAPGGSDDTLVGIGRSAAKIYRDLPAGVMGGVGYGVDASVLDGLLEVGKLGEQELPCRGTGGRVRQAPVAGVTVPGLGELDLDVVTGRSFGEQHSNGAAKAWTEGAVADVSFGPLRITGIVGRVNLRQGRSGRIVRNDIRGSSVGEVFVGGTSLGSFGPDEAGRLPVDGIPGLVAVELFKREDTKRGGSVSAVVLTLDDESAARTVVRLGNAKASLRRH